MARRPPLDRSAPAARKPSIVRPVIDYLEDDDDSIRTFVHDGVEHPPEGGQILDEEVLDSILSNERDGNPGFLDELSVEAVTEEHRVE